MSDNTNDGGPAFPVSRLMESGMSLRDYSEVKFISAFIVSALAELVEAGVPQDIAISKLVEAGMKTSAAWLAAREAKS